MILKDYDKLAQMVAELEKDIKNKPKPAGTNDTIEAFNRLLSYFRNIEAKGKGNIDTITT